MSDLDKPQFDASDVADMARLPIRSVHNWTGRGFADPYGARPEKRGGGLTRMYSLRDVLRFRLMTHLHQQYRVLLPQGKRICNNVFGESFNPNNPGIRVLAVSANNSILSRFCRDAEAAAQYVAKNPLATIINVGLILSYVEEMTREKTADVGRNVAASGSKKVRKLKSPVLRRAERN